MTNWRSPVYRRMDAHLSRRIEERRHQGLATYGRELEVDSGRDCLLDLLDEQLDAIQYTYQALEQRDLLLSALRALWQAHNDGCPACVEAERVLRMFDRTCSTEEVPDR